jgi:hypothetical protein
MKYIVPIDADIPYRVLPKNRANTLTNTAEYDFR